MFFNPPSEREQLSQTLISVSVYTVGNTQMVKVASLVITRDNALFRSLLSKKSYSKKN